MPLRDHFQPPISDFIPWESLDGTWPALMALDLNAKLSSRYIASPRIHLGATFEIDVAAASGKPVTSGSADSHLHSNTIRCAVG
jgi:hypothetical protein